MLSPLPQKLSFSENELQTLQLKSEDHRRGPCVNFQPILIVHLIAATHQSAKIKQTILWEKSVY